MRHINFEFIKLQKLKIKQRKSQPKNWFFSWFFTDNSIKIYWEDL